MLWAIGQEQNAQGRYNHNPRSISALETNNVVITDFYRKDELKYHGHTGQRGAATLNFYRELPAFLSFLISPFCVDFFQSSLPSFSVFLFFPLGVNAFLFYFLPDTISAPVSMMFLCRSVIRRNTSSPTHQCQSQLKFSPYYGHAAVDGEGCLEGEGFLTWAS